MTTNDQAGSRTDSKGATVAKAVWNGAVIAESDDVRVVDGYTYFPADAVDHRCLHPSDHRSVCPWKGTASYYDIVVDGETNPAAAWYYPTPTRAAAERVGGRIAFWRGVEIDHGDGSGQRQGLLGRLTSRRT